MLRRIAVVLAAASFAIAAWGQDRRRPANGAATERQAAGVRGVWKVIELSSRAPGEGWTVLTPEVSLYIFTEKHYSYMFTTGTGPRRLFAADPNKPSDAEKVGAYDSFVAASGIYVLAGSTLTLSATLHKNPNEMAGEPLRYTVEVDGDTLRMTIANPPFAPGRERRTLLTRVD